ncbi:histone-lysine N-methyltransferase SETD1A-like [Varanus komodoensis]|uniref:histone-lysine N-methyltransferase SETD1A-like n=1 Tax=Varanus komodoensis TaxID=61221 RepID=UPI001CF7D6F9|nr:histone-lysine N-methyltransferase SETD1A-like [Varanus komodoensis]
MEFQRAFNPPLRSPPPDRCKTSQGEVGCWERHSGGSPWGRARQGEGAAGEKGRRWKRRRRRRRKRRRSARRTPAPASQPRTVRGLAAGSVGTPARNQRGGESPELSAFAAFAAAAAAGKAAGAAAASVAAATAAAAARRRAPAGGAAAGSRPSPRGWEWRKAGAGAAEARLPLRARGCPGARSEAARRSQPFRRGASGGSGGDVEDARAELGRHFGVLLPPPPPLVPPPPPPPLLAVLPPPPPPPLLRSVLSFSRFPLLISVGKIQRHSPSRFALAQHTEDPQPSAKAKSEHGEKRMSHTRRGGKKPKERERDPKNYSTWIGFHCLMTAPRWLRRFHKEYLHTYNRILCMSTQNPAVCIQRNFASSPEGFVIMTYTRGGLKIQPELLEYLCSGSTDISYLSPTFK